MRKPRAQPEFQHQAALFTWARNPAVLAAHPELALLSSSLNGVKLTAAQAGKAKAAGMLKGEWDVRLPVARGPYHGLILEMKHGKNKLTPEQIEYGDAMVREGWNRAVCYDWTTAKEVIEWYLRLGTFARSGAICEPAARESGTIR